MSEHVSIETAEGVLALTLNRPEKKNALTSREYARLAEAIEAARDDAGVRAILIRAHGDMFCAGNDLSEFAAMNAAGAQQTEPPAVVRFLLALAHAGKPLVAAVQGHAVGIGLTMLLHCDLVFVAAEAKLSCPFVNLALVPEAASSLLLPARIGHVRAFELFTLGTAITGRQAADWGIANAALPASEVQAAALAAARALAAKPPAAVRVTRALLRDTPAIAQRIQEEFGLFEAQLRSAEAKEAFTAFFEKRPADFSKL